MACCCLCRTCAAVDRRRIKKFHGSSCDTARQVLCTLSDYPLGSLVETSDPSAILCKVCEKKLTTIHTLQTQLSSTKEDIWRLLSSLHRVGVINLGKRSIPRPESEVPSHKVTRLSHNESSDVQQRPSEAVASDSPHILSTASAPSSPSLKVSD